MRDKLIDIILAAQGFKEVGAVAEGYEAVYAAEVAARKAQAGKIADALIAAGVVQEWVSVEDAPPEEGVEVFGYNKEFGVNVSLFDGLLWYDRIGALTVTARPTHWMPSPAPPKEE